MKQNCTPPYETCVHGHFYRTALEAGVNEAKAVKLTEQLKKLHTIEGYTALNKDVSKIMSVIKKTIGRFPAKTRDEAVRVLYAVLYDADNLNNSYQSRIKIEEELGIFFLHELRNAIREAYYEPLQGETFIYTYENWLNGGYDKPPYTQEHYVPNYRKFIKGIMPDEEYQKILMAKKEVAERHINFYLDALKKSLTQRMEGAREPLAFLQNELDKVEKTLTDKERAHCNIGYEDGRYLKWLTFNSILPRNTSDNEGYRNYVAYWYKKVIIDNEKWIESHIEPKHVITDGISTEIQPVFAEAFYEYKKHLEILIAQHEGKPSPPPEMTNREFTTARQVLAIYHLLHFAQVRFENINKTDLARFTQFLTGKEAGNAKIENTTIYKRWKNIYSKSEENNIEDLRYIKTFFEKLGLFEIVKAIDNEMVIEKS